MNDQQLAQLLCPLCPQNAPFGDRHGSRFGSHQSLRQHYWRAHPGVEVELNYDPQSPEEQEKRSMVKKWVRYAMAVQAGLIQPDEVGPSQVTEIQDGPTNNQPPMVEPQRVFNRQPTRAAPVPDTAQPPAIPEPNTAVPPAIQPADGESVVCAECYEQIPASFLKQCQHVLHNHTDYTTATEAQFMAILKRCFPEAREFHNMTCLDCGRKLTGKKAIQEQLEHVESRHLSELGVHLRCPVTDCPDADVIQSTRIALLRHVKQYHGGVRGLDREAKKAYNRMRKEAEQMLVRVTRRYFPFTPTDACVNRRRQRPTDDDREVEGGAPAQSRMRLDAAAEEERETMGHPSTRDATKPRDDDEAVGESMEGDDEAPGGDGGTAGDDKAARGDDDEEEEDYGTAFFSFVR